MDRLLSSPTRLLGDVFALIYRGAPRFEARLWPDATLALSGDAGDYWLNTAVIDDGPAAGVAFGRAVAAFQERALPGWILHDESMTSSLSSIAQQFGLTDGGTAPFMVCRPAGSSSSRTPDGDLRIARVIDVAGVRMANRITAAAFSTPLDAVDRVWGSQLLVMPGLEIFLAQRDGEALGTVMTTRQGPLVGIWTMGVMPDCQRQGIGRHLLEAVLRHHRAQSAEAFYLVAFEAGTRLYEQTGFRTESDLHLWIAPADRVDAPRRPTPT